MKINAFPTPPPLPGRGLSSRNGKYAAPVMTLAKKIGIPVMLVDIRMEASHQELPGLDLLRHGTERALQW